MYKYGFETIVFSSLQNTKLEVLKLLDLRSVFCFIKTTYMINYLAFGLDQNNIFCFIEKRKKEPAEVHLRDKNVDFWVYYTLSRLVFYIVYSVIIFEFTEFKHFIIVLNSLPVNPDILCI